MVAHCSEFTRLLNNRIVDHGDSGMLLSTIDITCEYR